MVRTGIYGGTFNPIHNGHTQLGQALVQDGMVDELWFLVSPQNPLKVDQKLLDDEARLRLAHLAIQETEKLHVSDFEFHLPRPSYMVNTLACLSRQYPDREFILVIGADNWERFHCWYHAQEILQHYRLIIYPRPGYQIENIPQGVVVAQTPFINISSTDIRNSIGRGDYDGSGLHPAVWKEITLNGYYKNEKN